MTDAAAHMNEALRIVPANRASCEDLQAVFGERGSAAVCQCQRFKLAPGEAFKHHSIAERRRRLEEQTRCGRPRATTTSGMVAYLDGQPVGWCAVEPRPAYFGLLRVYRVPWDGRNEHKADETVWAVTCIFTRAGFRRRGIGYALAAAAIDFARNRGARALEAYPMIVEPGVNITWGELHMGTYSMFVAAGFEQASRPSHRRAVMRIDFDGRLPVSASANEHREQ